VSKPNLEHVLSILEMKERASRLYDEIDSRVAEIAEEFGAGRFDYDLEGVHVNMDFADAQRDKGRFLKFEIVDNVAELTSGATVWKSAGIKPISFSARALKRCPKSLA
jgi:hypothetical protein